MVQAILEGRKTQTRRIIKPDPAVFVGGTLMPRAECDRLQLRWTKGLPYKPTQRKPTKNGITVWEENSKERYEPIRCPFGQPDDRLLVRETWRPKGHNFPIGHAYEYRATAEQDGVPIDEPWRPSIHMPRDACRIMLEITDIRVERLQDISEEDAIAEGVESWTEERWKSRPTHYKIYHNEPGDESTYSSTAKVSFETLWQSVYGANSWDENPFVWAITFRQI